jgi:hypothetical protein
MIFTQKLQNLSEILGRPCFIPLVVSCSTSIEIETTTLRLVPNGFSKVSHCLCIRFILEVQATAKIILLAVPSVNDLGHVSNSLVILFERAVYDGALSIEAKSYLLVVRKALDAFLTHLKCLGPFTRIGKRTGMFVVTPC